MSLGDRLRGLFAKPYRTVTDVEAEALVAAGAILLDVREKHEYKAGHAAKARNIPLGQLGARHGELPAGRTVVTVCRSGMRSAQAARLLAAQGREVVNLRGGMHAWSRAGLAATGPVV
jgi:rhodanese-related sulfurtransferase